MADHAHSTLPGDPPAKLLTCILVTPEATLLEEPCDFIVLPLFDGEVGIAPLHSAMIGRIGFGEMRLTQGKKVRRFFVDGGFVQVLDDTVAILTNRALTSDQLDPAAIEQKLTETTAAPAENAEAHAAQRALEARLRKQLAIAKKARERVLV